MGDQGDVDEPRGATATDGGGSGRARPGRGDQARLPGAARGRRPRRTGVTLAGLSAVASAAAAGVGIGLAGRWAQRLTDPPFLAPADPPGADDRVTIHAVVGDEVLLAGDGAERPGTWGVATSGAYARLGAVRERTAAGVRRPVTVLDGDLVPDHGVLDAAAHVDRPTSLHPDGEVVVVPGELGDLPAHQVRGDDTWAIGVHGRAGGRHQTFRALGPLVAAGRSALAISYRNDRDAPRSPDGRSHLGGTEWRDLVAAMDHARRHGARRLLLVGLSMGGAIVGQVLARAQVDDVVAVVLDAPVVDWHPVVARAARDLGVPGPAVPLVLRSTRAIARTRHRVDLDALRLDPGVLDVPTLLVHGVDDQVVPVAGSDRLAADRADLVTYLRVPGGGHVRSWNADPATYEAAITALLARLA